MKFIILILIIFSANVNAQLSFNKLSNNEFSNITIDEVALKDLLYFQGGAVEMNELFSQTFVDSCNDPVGEAKTLESRGLKLSYFGFSPEQELINITIDSDRISILIKGIELRVGRSLEPLIQSYLGFESFACEDCSNNSQIAVFKSEDIDSFIMIYFNPMSKVTTSIKYISPL